MDVSGELHAPTSLLPGKNFGVHLIGGWVAPKDSLDGFGNEKNLKSLPWCEFRAVQRVAEPSTDCATQLLCSVYISNAATMMLDQSYKALVFAVHREVVPTQTWLRAVTTHVCKPEAANIVGAPDDERHTARNMLSF